MSYRIGWGETNMIDAARYTLLNYVNPEPAKSCYKNPFTIKKVIFNNPATIVFWADGTKTVVKCGEDDFYDAEKGLAMAISKKALGNQSNYYKTFKKHLPEEEEVNDEAASLFCEQLYNMFLGM